MRAGQALTQLVEFTDGFPDGDITWELLDGAGSPVTSGTVTPVPSAVSSVIAVAAVDNGIIEAGALSEPRELQWSYAVAGLLKSGRLRYRLDAFLPLGVSESGVRNKLGLETHELEDEAIDLVGAYSRFRDQVTAASLDDATGLAALKARDAVEAMAAMGQIPALQVKLASKQSSGTDQFQREKIDWNMIRGQLDQYIAEGIAAVNPDLSLVSSFGSLVQTIDRDDPVTGTAA